MFIYNEHQKFKNVITTQEKRDFGWLGETGHAANHQMAFGSSDFHMVGSHQNTYLPYIH